MSEIFTTQNGEAPRKEGSTLVLDTNTVLALWMFCDPALDTLRTWIETGSFRLYSREDALEELRRVLAYRQFKLSTHDQARILENYQKRTLLHPLGKAAVSELPACRDADDQKFLELAVETNSAYLLTRDKALLKLGRHRNVRRRVTILTPEHLLDELCARRPATPSPARDLPPTAT